MENIKNSCNNRGCEYIRVLPTCGSVINVYSGVFQKRNDTEAILSIAQPALDSLAFKKAA